MLHPSTVDRIAGLFLQSSLGLFPYLSIALIAAPVSTGLLSYLLTASLVEASTASSVGRYTLLSMVEQSTLLLPIAANSVVNVGLEH
jgi:hypothetical protein